jgi:uncharacterized protein
LLALDPAPTVPGPPPPASAAPPGVLLFFLALAPLFVLGLLAQAAHPVFGLAWTEIFVLLLPALIAAEAAGLRTAPLLRLRWPGTTRVALGLAVGLAGYLLASGLMLGAVRVLPPHWVEANDIGKLFELPGWQPAGIALVASVLAPLCEEVTFRGYVLSAFARRRPAVAIAGTALLFAVMHVDPVRFVAVFALGLLFGWLAWRSGSIWPAVAAHAANNGSASALAFLAGRTPEAEEPTFSAIAGVLLVGAAIVAAVAAAFRRATPVPPPLTDALVAARPDAAPPALLLRRVAPELLVAAAIGLALVPVLLLHAKR